MMANAEGALDELRHTSRGPEVAEEAMLLGALLQKSPKLLQLLVGELGLLAWMRDSQQSVGTMSSSLLEPLADGAFCDPERDGDVALLPAQFLQHPGSLAPFLTPVACLPCSCLPHPLRTMGRMPLCGTAQVSNSALRGGQTR